MGIETFDFLQSVEQGNTVISMPSEVSAHVTYYATTFIYSSQRINSYTLIVFGDVISKFPGLQACLVRPLVHKI